VRHETCLYCKIAGAGDQDVNNLIMISESLGPLTHHHHTIKCGGCSRWWFDDVTIGGLGLPVSLRRDTELCDCDEDLPQYTLSCFVVPQPEDQCACTKAKCEEFSLPIRLGRKP
jgi:hypothetical protein